MNKIFITSLAALFLFTKATKLLSQKTDKPNFVFILADDCPNWDIGCYGSKGSKTPNIDKLAEEGIKFNRCYQAAPMCSPTRHKIYTGLDPVDIFGLPKASTNQKKNGWNPNMFN